MPYWIPEDLVFPRPEWADASGLLGVGGDLRPERVMLAYAHGIFPWYSDGQPILWWSPDPRMVLYPPDLVIQRSLRKRIAQEPYRLTMDTAFEAVIDRCATVPRPMQDGTWITREMRDAYVELHRLGHAHSVEAWQGDRLVGGLYGVALGSAFFGESMFAEAKDASKIAFVAFIRQLECWGCTVVDCQVYTEHLARFGAVEVPRSAFLRDIQTARHGTLPSGRWHFDEPAGD